MITLLLFFIDYTIYNLTNYGIIYIKKFLGLSFTFRYKYIFKIHDDIQYNQYDYLIRHMSQYLIMSLYHLGYIGVYSYENLLIKLLIAIIIQDIGYYMYHRLMHHKYFYNKWHKYRHQKITTSWGAISYSIVESNIENIILMLPIFLIRMNPYYFHGLLILARIWNAINYESTFRYNLTIFKSPVSHLIHNQFENYNYGFWTNICDMIGGTYKEF